jgi:hypothetical protein
MESESASEVVGISVGDTLDGVGAGDHDVEYRFGGHPNTELPYPFSTRQYARLLGLRSRVQAGLFGADDL